MRNFQKKPTCLFLLIVLTFTCSAINLKTKNLTVGISNDGEITSILRSDGIKIAPFHLATDLLGCKVEGVVHSRMCADGSFLVEKKLVNDSLRASCILTEHFIPAQNSIRCELTIRGEGEPWGTLIDTKVTYPNRSGKTKIWTTWAAPQFDSLQIGVSLPHDLTKIKPPDGDRAHYWIDPLIPVPFVNATYYYGAPYFQYNKMDVGFIPNLENLISIPLVSMFEENEDAGLTIAHSPGDNIINLTMKTTTDGSVTFSRLHNRISNKNTLVFSFDLIAHQNDWRCALAWMKSAYPEFFLPKNPLANQMGGTAAYSSYSMESMNFDVPKMKRMAFTVNWQASFDFPYMGMYLPPVQRNEKWKRFGGDQISIAGMDDFAGKYREKGFYVLNYFNVTEFGSKVKYPPLSRVSQKPDSEIWKDCNDILYTKFAKAILPVPEACIKDAKLKNGAIPVPFYTWEDGIAMDCGDSVYSDFLVDQARRHVAEIPNSFGICIDRFDWFRMFNERADDGISWFEGKPVRSLVTSWKNLSPKLSAVMHGANKVIFANNHDKRIDLLSDVDGLFDEFTYCGNSLNLTAFMCIAKPALGWTDHAETVRREGGDSFFQKYLYMGVFPMCPFPNNDHSISQSPDVDRFYEDYGPLMKLMQGREWVLKPHVISVRDGLARVNLFKIKGGYSIPLVYGRQDQVEVVLDDPDGLKEGFKCLAWYPGSGIPVIIEYRKTGKRFILNVPLVRGCAMLEVKNNE